MSRAPHWTIADVLDFEWLLARDRAAGEDTRPNRDHTIYEKIVARSPEMAGHRRPLFRAWLEERRAEAEAPFPGAYFLSGWQTLVTAAILIGLGLGSSVTVGLLHYRNAEPVNVSWFLALTIGVQMLVLFLVLLFWLIRASTHWLTDFRPLRALLTAITWALSTGLRRLPGDQRDHIRAALSVMRHRREIYGSLASWPFLVATQLFAVAYNIGILATLGTHLAFANLHFQWESTLVQSPAAAHQIVSAVALPWSKFIPAATVTFMDVEASHNIDSVRFHQLLESNGPRLQALVAWWPFLCVSVAVYGLLLRGALLLFAAAKWRSSLRSLRFDHADANALWRRLSGPLVTAPPEAGQIEPSTDPDQTSEPHSAGTCFALLAQELSLNEAALRTRLAQEYGWKLTRVWPVKIDNRQESSVALRELHDAVEGVAGIVVVAPLERDPIVAIALFLKDVVTATGPGAEVILVLAGPPEMEERLKFWRNFNAMHHLHLGLERWAP